MDMSLRLHTTDEGLAAAIVGAPAERGAEVAIAGQLRLRYLGTETQRAVDPFDLIMFALSVPVGISTSMIAEALGRYLRQKGESHRIQKAVVVLKEKVEKTDSDGRRTVKTTTKYVEIPMNSGRDSTP